MKHAEGGKAKLAALYERLSRDDGTTSESNSIINQKIFLEQEAKRLGFYNFRHYTDDGYSGLNINRPGIQKLIKDIKKGKICAVLVKDLSRLGRNYIENGRLQEEFFPEHDVRFISLMDGVDSASGSNFDHYAYINVTNQQLAITTSRKLKLTNSIKGASGIPLGRPPYGYMKNPENKKFWVIDENAAKVVRSIFEMYLSGYGTYEIAKLLTEKGIPTPTAYRRQSGRRCPGRTAEPPGRWHAPVVNTILRRQEYVGDVVNHKTYSKTPKNKKRYRNSPENIKIFKGVHRRIIDRTKFDMVQQIMSKSKKRASLSGRKNIFAGLLVCGDCGGNLNMHCVQSNPDMVYYSCSNNNSGRGCSTTHHIRRDFLEQVVMAELRELMRCLEEREADFAVYMKKRLRQKADAEKTERRQELDRLSKRKKELDMLSRKVYEDNAAGKISDDSLRTLSSVYEQEKAELAEKIKTAEARLSRTEDESAVDNFIASVRKYTRVTKLSARMLNELIDKIEVFDAKKQNGVWVQRINIYYRCIGSIYTRQEEQRLIHKMQQPVEITTRPGVTLTNKPRTPA